MKQGAGKEAEVGLSPCALARGFREMDPRTGLAGRFIGGGSFKGQRGGGKTWQGVPSDSDAGRSV